MPPISYIGFLENRNTPTGLGLVSFERRSIYGNFKAINILINNSFTILKLCMHL